MGIYWINGQNIIVSLRVHYYNMVWTQYTLGTEEQRPLNGSLNYYAISQLEVFRNRSGKIDETPYVEAFIILHQEKKSQRTTTVWCGGLSKNSTGNLDKRA